MFVTRQHSNDTNVELTLTVGSVSALLTFKVSSTFVSSECCLATLLELQPIGLGWCVNLPAVL
jgi:hypothetical protein